MEPDNEADWGNGMKSSLASGLTTTRRITVDRSRTIGFMGEGGRVYATPELVRDVEVTCRNLLLEHLDEGEDSVGTRVEGHVRDRGARYRRRGRARPPYALRRRQVQEPGAAGRQGGEGESRVMSGGGAVEPAP